MAELFEYLELHSINNSFTNSLKEYNDKYSSLSEKQIAALKRIIDEHKNIIELFERIDTLEFEPVDKQKIDSIRSQFIERKSLSPKQLNLLKYLSNNKRTKAEKKHQSV